MSSKFKYDIVTLIELVESRACLWDKTSDEFKDREMKNKLWLEVYSFLEPNFIQLDRKEQIKVGNLIKEKWNNIRDAFTRSLRKKSGQAATKNYLYNDVLQFLLRTTDKDETESSIRRDDNNETAETQEEKEMEIAVQQSEYEETSTSGGGAGDASTFKKEGNPNKRRN
uniref:MADF domain-containing protein n=1 Tax=Timema bartmani TaxID=61472 RepID=A0A7R9F599_9NEOP|nr:unnamed protein product [Timema bartmani]